MPVAELLGEGQASDDVTETDSRGPVASDDDTHVRGVS